MGQDQKVQSVADVAYQTPGDIGISVVCLAVSWVGGLRDDTVWLFEVTLAVHQKIALYWCHHLHHHFHLYFPVATPNTGSGLDQMEGGGHIERDQYGFPIVCLQIPRGVGKP